MARAKNIAKCIREELETRLGKSYCWIINWAPRRNSRETVDVVGEPRQARRRRVLVEIEIRRGNPVSNVAKIWKWIEHDKIAGTPLILFQAFSKYYRKGDGSYYERQRSAEFLGRKFGKLVSGVKYHPINWSYDPRKGALEGGGAMIRHARKLAKDIARGLRKTKKKR